MTRNLVLSGGVGHDFGTTSALLAAVLAEEGVKSEVETDIVAGVERAAAGHYDMVTVNALRWRMLADRYAPQRAAHGFSMPAGTARDLAGFVAGGGSLLGVHTASICFDDWASWKQVLGGVWRWEVSSHPPLGPARVAATAVAHPLTEGLDEFDIVDEIYGFLDLEPDVQPLLTSAHGGADHPVLWARSHGSGRVVYDALGHDRRSYESAEHRRVLRRAARWLTGQSPSPTAS